MSNLEKLWLVLETVALNGPVKASYVAKATGVERCAVYRMLNRLEACGLVEISGEDIRRFSAGPRLRLVVDNVRPPA